MALRLRRGTDAERLTITPVEGELIYTTDLQELWIGDGVTTGGNKIGGIIPQFLTDLSNVDAASPEIGQVLKWDGNNWVASDDEDTGVVEGASYKINILGTSNTTIVDSDTATFTGSFVGDGSGLTNLPVATDGSGIVEGSNYRINIVDDSSTVMLDTSTTTFTGNFVGDGSGLTNLPGVTSLSIFDLNDVFSVQELDEGDLLVWDGFNFVNRTVDETVNFDDLEAVNTSIRGDDSVIIVDANTNTFNGNFIGDGSGLTNITLDDNSLQKVNILSSDSSVIVDINTNSFFGNFDGDGSRLNNVRTQEGLNYRINIIGDDSTVMVDTSNNSINAEALFITSIFTNENNLSIRPISETNTQIQQISVVSNENRGQLNLTRISEDDISSDNSLIYGMVVFGRDDLNGPLGTSLILSRRNSLVFSNDVTGQYSDPTTSFYWVDNKLGISTGVPEKKLDVNGDAIVRGNLDINNGLFNTASFTTVERDNLTPQNGSIIYNSTVNKFQGYADGVWIDLN